MRGSTHPTSWARGLALVLTLLISVILITTAANSGLLFIHAGQVPTQPVAAYQFVGQGAVTSINGTLWTVGGLPVTVIDQTTVAGNPTVGNYVSISGMVLSGVVLSGNVWLAQMVRVIAPVDPLFRFTAPIVQKGANIWQTGSVQVVIGGQTRLIGNLELGTLAEVTFQVASDGSLLALVIEAKSGQTPTETVTITFLSTATPFPPIIINCYQITFLGVVYNPDNTSTWSYHVMELPCAQDLSNWLLSLPTCTQPVAATPDPWEYVNPDPNFQLPGIKWQVGNGFTQGVFSVTLSGHWALGTTRFGVKGPDVGIGDIAGPTCAPITPTPVASGSGTPTVLASPTAVLNVTPSATFLPPPPTSTPVPPSPQPSRPPSGNPIVVTDNDQTLTFTCNGNSVDIRGNANNITLLGNCGAVTIRGNENRVSIQSATSVTNTGNGNQIVGP